jgi:hypothetical protein
MKKLILIIGVSALLLLSSCIILPPNEIAVEAEIDEVVFVTSPNGVVINYTVTNIGEYDLNDVQVQFGVDVFGPVGNQYSYTDVTQWSPKFYLDRYVSKSYTITIYDANISALNSMVSILAIGMDNPPDDY